MKTVIYQIGRIDTGLFNKVSFVIEGMSFRTGLSSFAIKEFLAQRNITAEVFLLYPVSLPFQPFLLKDERFITQCDKKCLEALKEINDNPDNYLKNPEELFRYHPHSDISDGFLILPSLGTYNTLNGQVIFNYQYQDIVLKLVFFMIRSYLSNPNVEKYIIDISSGHNIYTTALIEAVRYFCVWLKLYRWSEKIPIIETAISEPVIPGVEIDHRIYFEKVDVKAMFSSPVTYEDIKNYSLSRLIYPSKDDRRKKQHLQKMLQSFVQNFSAIKNNIPLIIFLEGYPTEDQIIDTLNQIIEDGERLFAGEFRTSPGLNKSAYIKCLLALGFYRGLVKIFSKNEVDKCSDKGVALKKIRQSFQCIYRLFNLGLNDIILGNEVDKLFKDIIYDKKESWLPLIRCLKNNTGQTTEPQKRNFFAHAGLEKNLTECKIIKDNDGKKQIFVRYVEDRIDLIKQWILEALDE